jgi:hypothetical protein
MKRRQQEREEKRQEKKEKIWEKYIGEDHRTEENWSWIIIITTWQ